MSIDNLSILFNEREVLNRIKMLSSTISSYYKNKNSLIFICILKGSFIFFSDLVKEISVDIVQVDFMQTSSYGNLSTSSLDVKIRKDIDLDIRNKNILIIDDIADTGFTLNKVINSLKNKNPREIKTCVLVDKPFKRLIDLKVDFVGFELKEDCFVVGYGIDFNEEYRALKGIYKL